MRRTTAATICVFALASCGGSGHHPTPRPPNVPAAAALTAWADAATRFNAEIRMCLGKINPVRGFWAACTNAEQRRYERAATEASEALGTVRAAGTACLQAKSMGQQVVTHLTGAWRRAWLADGRAISGGRPHGPTTPATLGDRAEKETAADIRLVPGLAAALRRNCG